MHKSRFLSLLLCVCLVISSIPAIKTDAKSADSIIYQQDGIEIYYGVDSSWSGAFNAHITIKNRSQKDVENWGLQFEFSNKISNIWNGKILSNENQTYTVKNAGYNQDLKKGSEVTIGFSANGDAKVLPDNIALCSEEFVVEDGYSTKLVVNSDWGSGFSGAIELSNTGKEAIEDWTIEFDFNRDIDTIWNGVIVKREGSHYVIKNADYNQKILPGQSVSIGFNGHKGNVKTETINNVKLSSFGSVSTTPKVVEGRVKIDTSMLIPDEENIFFMPKDVYSIIGTVENSSNVKKLTYSSNNTFGLDLLSGELTIGDNWAIENIPLILGYNELTVTALYKDNTVSSDTIIIAYMYDDRMDGFDNLVIDSDSDGLEDYIEAIYGTDPLKKDTDEDGLSDYTELVVMGTDPLKADTDGNGILDGNEDYDKDGLSNKEEEELGTLLYGVDSDYDDLTDYDEVHKYNTNPVLADTDGDGASDGFEVANGYDPLTAETSFKVEKTVDVGGTTYELLLTADGENIESLEVIPVNNSGAKYGLIPGYLDAAVDFRINGTFESAKLKVYFDESYLEIEGFVPALYYIDEENHEMVEIPGEWDGVSNYFYVDVPHFSTYITLNKTEFIRVWENAIKAHAITQDGKTNLNIVFVTDLSGSMRGSKITTMKSSINAFIDVLSPSDKAAVVSFTSSATVLSGLTSDKTVLKQIVSSMSVGGMTAIYTGLDKAVEILENPDVSGYKMIIVFTDGYDEPSTTYDGQYKSIVERALKADISIQTIGIGTIDSALLTKVAQNTGGSFYYAENASALTSQVTQVQEDIIDYTKDSNNDGISDYFTKLLCDGKLITWRGEPILIGATYEEVQNDSDGDLDNDGIKNGEELILQTNEDKVVNITVKSDMEDPDTDGDTLSDGLERNLGTNINFTDIYETDFNRIANNDLYVASLTSEDYIDGWWLKFQLAAGNAILRHKLSYVEDYKRALIDFINAYNETTFEQTAIKQIADFYEADWNENVRAYVKVISDVAGETAELADKIAQFKEACVHMNHSLKQLRRMDQWVKFKEVNKIYITERMKYSKYFGEVQELSPQLRNIELPKFVVDASPKVKNVVGKVALGISIAAYTLDTIDSVYNSCVAYGSLNNEFLQYEKIIDFLEYVEKFSEISELREAAYQVRLAIVSDKARTIQTVKAIAGDIINTATNVGVDVGVAILSKSLGPAVWAASFGLALGDLLAGTSALDEETLKVIALGNSADTYAERLRNRMVKDGSICYLADDGDIDILQLVAQLRIVGADETARAHSKNGIVTKFINWIVYCSQAEFENDMKDSILKLETTGTNIGVKVSGKFANAYLKYN